MDVSSKILSCVLTERAYKLLELNGIQTQYGATPKVGCQDANFVLKTALHLRHQHNLPSFVAFVDLVKAYDTANHELLIALLARYGAPEELCEVVKRLYADLTVAITIEGEKLIIPQTSGIRQGDNLSPVLFLFLMSAVAEYLNKEWDTIGKQRISCNRVNLESDLHKGVLISQPASKLNQGEAFELLEILFIDDGAFIFNSRDDLCCGLEQIRKVFAKFGLDVHIGKGDEPSKTECMYVQCTYLNREDLNTSLTPHGYKPPPPFFPYKPRALQKS